MYQDYLGLAGDHKITDGGIHADRFIEAEYHFGDAFAESFKFGDGFLNGNGIGPWIEEKIVNAIGIQKLQESLSAFIHRYGSFSCCHFVRPLSHLLSNETNYDGVSGTVYLTGKACRAVIWIDDMCFTCLHLEDVIETGLNANRAANTSANIYLLYPDFTNLP